MTTTVKYDDRVRALAQHLGVKPGQVEEDGLEELSVNGGRETYVVMTDKEADDAYERALENYVEDVIMPEIPEAYQMYFDDRRWKDDAYVNGSRGEELNRYDGVEHMETVDGVDYYIYQTN